VNSIQIRFFSELTDEEADKAIGIIRKNLSDRYERGDIDLLFDYRTEDELQDALWDIAGGIAESAVFVPDDGTYIVRL
jgi:hypothetical protein